MKKHIALLATAALFCVLFTSSCKHESEDGTHTDTAFLRGKWESANNAVFTFTINADLSFECVLKKVDTIPTSVNAKIKGKLDADTSGLGPNDYILRNLQTMEDGNYPDNETIKEVVENTMNGIMVTLTPKENYTRFAFSSQNQLAQSFFGLDGDFVKKP
jgi:hypothetical protein